MFDILLDNHIDGYDPGTRYYFTRVTHKGETIGGFYFGKWDESKFGEYKRLIKIINERETKNEKT